MCSVNVFDKGLFFGFTGITLVEFQEVIGEINGWKY